jgi:hypothetical protein
MQREQFFAGCSRICGKQKPGSPHMTWSHSYVNKRWYLKKRWFPNPFNRIKFEQDAFCVFVHLSTPSATRSVCVYLQSKQCKCQQIFLLLQRWRRRRRRSVQKLKDGTKNVAATCTIKQMSAIIFHIIVYTSFLTPCISFSFRATITANGCNFLLLLSRHLEIHFLRRRRPRRPKKHFAAPSPVLLEPSFLSGLPISTLGQNVYLNSAPNQPHIRMISDKSNCLPPSTLHLYCRAAAAAAEHAVCVFGCLALTLTDAPLECRCLCLLLLLLLLLLLSLLLLLAFKPPETHHQDLFVHVNPLLPNYEKIRRRKEVRCRPSLMTPFVVSATMQCSSKKDGGTVQTYWS